MPFLSAAARPRVSNNDTGENAGQARESENPDRRAGEQPATSPATRATSCGTSLDTASTLPHAAEVPKPLFGGCNNHLSPNFGSGQFGSMRSPDPISALAPFPSPVGSFASSSSGLVRSSPSLPHARTHALTHSLTPSRVFFSGPILDPSASVRVSMGKIQQCCC